MRRLPVNGPIETGRTSLITSAMVMAAGQRGSAKHDTSGSRVISNAC